MTQPINGSVVKFAQKALVVLTATSAFLGLLMLVNPWMPWTIKADAQSETAARIAADSLMVESVTRLATIMELQAIITIEPPNSSLSREARMELRAMRTLALTPRR